LPPSEVVRTGAVADGRELAAAFVERLERRDWDGLGELLHPGVVYEIAQSRERIRGRDRYIQFNADGWITKVTDFWPEPYEPPAGREHLVERWRSSEAPGSAPLTSALDDPLATSVRSMAMWRDP